MIDLPPELWMHIASYLPNDSLCELYGLNSLFFDASMSLRWRDVTLESRNLPEGMHVFQRLSDPFIAAKVKKLSVLCSRLKESSVRHADPPASRLRNSVKFLRRTVAHRPSDPLHEFMDQVTALSPKLTGLHELCLDASELPPVYALRSVCKSFWAGFGTHLRVLALGGNVESYRAIVESTDTHAQALPKLAELRLEFTGNIFQFRENANDPELQARDAAVMRMLAAFVNGLSAHLEGLRVWSWAVDLDTSPFFNGLGVFPKLQYLGVRMPFDKGLRDPQGLKDVLCNHPALKKVELRLNPSRFHLNVDQEDLICRWLVQCLANERCFSQVCSLDVYPTTTAEGTAIILAAIKRISDTVERLIVRDRYLQHDEALSIIDAASGCPRLRSLRMNVFRFSDIGLLDRLAEKLPNLEALWISIGDHAHANDITTLGVGFTEALKTRSYDKWRLKDLAVWQSGAEIDIDTMHILAASIPGLESFFEGEVYL